MAKDVPSAIIDQMLDIIETATTLHISDGQPTDYSNLVNTTELAKTTISGSFVKANGSPSGRQTTCPAQSGVTVDANGTADHVVTTNGVDTIISITTCTPQAVTAGGTLDTSSFIHTITNAVT